MITEEELENIKKRINSATPGPWKAQVEGRDFPLGGDTFIMTGEGEKRTEDIYLTGATIADIDFIANARQDVPTLIRELEELKRRIS